MSYVYPLSQINKEKNKLYLIYRLIPHFSVFTCFNYLKLWFEIKHLGAGIFDLFSWDFTLLLTGHIMTDSFMGRGNQNKQLDKVLYCKLPTSGKGLPTFLHKVWGLNRQAQR